MQLIRRFTAFFNRFISVPVTDPDDARRRRLLNIILAGVLVLSPVTIIVAIALLLAGGTAMPPDLFMLILGAGLAMFLGAIAFYYINRRASGWLASSLFLVFLMAALGATDTPKELVDGRSIFVFVIPIIMASMLLNPVASFVFVILTIFELTLLANMAGTEPNTFAMVGFAMIALIAWLSSRSLEQALNELRRTNANLDRMVNQRTQALVESLARERAEAGRSLAILDSIADGVIVFDIQGKALMANPAISRLFGWPVESITGSTMDELARSEALSPASRAVVSQILAGGQEVAPGLRIEWGKKVLSASIAQVRDSSDENIGSVAVFRDFTREAEIEKMKSTFVAMVSHELRTPLNAILGFAEMLKEAVYGPINQKQAESAARILSNTQRLLSIVNDLLDQAQIEAGKLTVVPRPFKPAELLVNVHGVMDKMAADKGLMLTSQLESGVPEILNGDSERLQQILVNLVSNAVKFTDHGSIHIRICALGQKEWMIEVRDSGRGIARDTLPRIFDSFHQGDGAATRQQRGVGLGLSIVKQLVQLMGGVITVQSELGIGSVFTVSLPLVFPQEVRA